MNDKNYDLIKFEDGDFSLDVNVSPSEDTVWLSLDKISILFDRDKSVISRHINNTFKEQELDENSVIAFFATTAKDGKTYIVKYYNLDMILAVGYKVKSRRGTLFRRWANSILKQYLLNGHVINKERCIAHSDNIIKINNTINDMNSRLSNVELRLDNITSIDIYK